MEWPQPSGVVYIQCLVLMVVCVPFHRERDPRIGDILLNRAPYLKVGREGEREGERGGRKEKREGGREGGRDKGERMWSGVKQFGGRRIESRKC